ncbi:hypothetical protein QGN29_01500 [Temperatibacter marinus]|uniref:Sulfotransferase n=1 Tax=Temperatibacter marinus TaxID=1456591 RepID=A0AA52HAW5_9PROT|nr:hypothetical protein [Temperatibacter marinus]WND03038.1 hypothetical protein QGN29_01500 [Temperatibacter marinus]
MIIIGLGSGRSGTNSFAAMIAKQQNSYSFHEMNPSVMAYKGTVAPVVNTLREFKAIIEGGDPSYLTVDLSRKPSVADFSKVKVANKVDVLSDAGLYYLQYVPDMLAENSAVKFVCLQRDRTATIQSFMKKTTLNYGFIEKLLYRCAALIKRKPYISSSNHFMEHDGRQWAIDRLWDKCFPTFEAASKEEAIGHYYDYYYKQAHMFALDYPENVKVYPLEMMNKEEGIKEILSFCGYKEAEMVIEPAWVNQNG